MRRMRRASPVRYTAAMLKTTGSRLSGIPLFAVLLLLCFIGTLSAAAESDESALLTSFSAEMTRLAPQTIEPATERIPRDNLTPAGYYKSTMWDWDGYYIGAHWANQKAADAKYLKWWVLNFSGFVDGSGYVAGCITPKGPLPVVKPIVGRFNIKPFLAQGAYLASERLHDYSWIAPVWETLQHVDAYRQRTQFDPKYGVYFWENAMQSGADDNAALTNDPKDRNAILAVDASVFVLREDLAMAAIARHLGHAQAADQYLRRAAALKQAILKNLWSEQDAMFWNRRRDTGEVIKRMSYSNFTPLTDDILTRTQARSMIKRHLLNPAEMRGQYGFRSLSKEDPDYNNRPIIDPYSNWRGPVWLNANYLNWIGLRRYGFAEEAHSTAVTIAEMLARDIAAVGTMHEDYDSDTGLGLAPTAEESPGGKFTGFVGWNLLAEDMLQCEVAKQHCMMLASPDSAK